eukprot:168640-Amorphochlora_amoeboformis.AAC.1
MSVVKKKGDEKGGSERARESGMVGEKERSCERVGGRGDAWRLKIPLSLFFLHLSPCRLTHL